MYVYSKHHTIICPELQPSFRKGLAIMRLGGKQCSRAKRHIASSLAWLMEENDKLLSRTKAATRVMQQ